MQILICRFVAAVAGLALLSLVGITTAVAQKTQITVPPLAGKQIEISALELRDGRAERAIHLPEGRARMIRLPVEVRDILVADPAVADVVVMSSKRIYLIGLAAGTTNAFFLDDKGNELLRLDVRVQLDVVSANQSLRALLPDTDVKVTAVKSHLFLTGNVRTAGIAEIARVIASRFVADEANVVNMVVVTEDRQSQAKPAPSVIARMVDDKPLKIKIYRAASPSTVVINK